MITQKQINTLSMTEGVGWITALKTGAIRKLASSGTLQMGLFDTKNLFAIEHPDFPGERLVACKNHELGRLRAHKRESLLNATTKVLEGIQKTVSRGRITGKAEIGVRIGKSINRYKVAKHFVLKISDKSFTFERRHDAIAVEAAVDGIYVVRTSIPKSEVSDEDAVRNYKKLANVERAFRTMKSVSLKVRPIHHHLESRVRAHIFLCMLAYYVEWHMREALRPILFSDEDQAVKATRDPGCSGQALTRGAPKGAQSRARRRYPGALILDADGQPRNDHPQHLPKTRGARGRSYICGNDHAEFAPGSRARIARRDRRVGSNRERKSDRCPCFRPDRCLKSGNFRLARWRGDFTRAVREFAPRRSAP